jgi:hypothetical protein
MTATEESTTDAQPTTSTENNCTNEEIPESNAGGINGGDLSPPTTTNNADANTHVKKV